MMAVSLWAAFILSSCSMPSIKQPIDVNVFYKRDMSLTVNGKTGVGVVMAKKADRYEINGISKGDLMLLSMRSCHREITQENANSAKRTFMLDYWPVPGLEDNNCVVELGGFDSKHGRHSWGVIDFEDPDGVVGYTRCNGGNSSGLSTICQAPAGLKQEVSFDEEMEVAQNRGCDFGSLPKKSRVFHYTMPKRECVLAFVSASGKTHRHVTVGYERVLLREN